MVRTGIRSGWATRRMWSARVNKALMAALSKYSTAVRSTVSVSPVRATSAAAALRAWSKASTLLKSISPAAIDQHGLPVAAARGVEGERCGHHVILADR